MDQAGGGNPSPESVVQLFLALDWGPEPWHGRSPRSLTKGFREASCVVDKSSVKCQSREAQRIGTDPAQLQICLEGNPNGS